MNKRIIPCNTCGKEIGYYPVFSHRYDEEDSGEAQYNEDYGGEIEGDDYCIDCYPDAIRKLDEELELASKVPVQGQAHRSSEWHMPGTLRGWGPLMRLIGDERERGMI
jgi:hypothetical protein